MEDRQRGIRSWGGVLSCVLSTPQFAHPASCECSTHTGTQEQSLSAEIYVITRVARLFAPSCGAVSRMAARRRDPPGWPPQVPRHPYGYFPLPEFFRKSLQTLYLRRRGDGGNPKIVQERLGHSSIAITMDVYSHSIAGMDKAAAGTFDAMLASQKRLAVAESAG